MLSQLKLRIFREIERFALTMNRLGLNYNPFHDQLVRSSSASLENQTRKSLGLLAHTPATTAAGEQALIHPGEKALFCRDHFRFAFKSYLRTSGPVSENHEFKDQIENFLLEVNKSSRAIVWLIDRLNDDRLKSSLLQNNRRSGGSSNNMAMRKKLTDALTP